MAGTCRLFGAFGWSVQALLGVLCFCSLFVKRYREYPKRNWLVFSMDATKQAISTAFAHAMNVLIAVLLSEKDAENPCVWYFINIMIDCTLGVLIAFILLKSITTFALKRGYERFRTGEYYLISNRPDLKAWAIQLFVWCFVVMVSKWTLVGVIILIRSMLSAMGEYFLSPLAVYPELELVVVMVVVPCFLNVIQFWVQDNFLKGSSTPEPGKHLLELQHNFESVEELNWRPYWL